MNRIGIATVFTGYNYGSSLQAYATKQFLRKIGYESVVMGQRGSLVPGRDIRIKKIITMASRSLLYPTARKNIKVYRESPAKVPTDETKMMFNDFTVKYIKPDMKRWGKLKSLAKTEEYSAFLCGSDQIWNADALYVDPFYYLQFAPFNKRIAFAPSFGRERVASYNRRIITKYINSIPHLSVREKSGVKVVSELTNRKAIQILDPTLMLSCNEWNACLNITLKESDYILAYFLNDPTDKAQKVLRKIADRLNKKIVALPHRNVKEDWYDETVPAGPKEFVELIANASFICTDSFHGTAFSINYKIPFYVFDRQYGAASKQSSRITSLLELVCLECRYEPDDLMDFDSVDFSNVDNCLELEREKAKHYVKVCINEK